MEWFGDILRSDNDITKKVLTENIHKKIPKADHERDGKMQWKKTSRYWEGMYQQIWH